MSILPQFLYKFNTIPIKIQARFFIDIDKITLKFIHIGRRTKIHIGRRTKTILKTDKVGIICSNRLN